MKKKMKLDELKVQSFVTEEMDGNAETVKGGGFINNTILTIKVTFISCAAIGCDTRTTGIISINTSLVNPWP